MSGCDLHAASGPVAILRRTADPSLLFFLVCPAPALLKLPALPFAECEWLNCVRCACAGTCTAGWGCDGIIDGASSTVIRRGGGLCDGLRVWNALHPEGEISNTQDSRLEQVDWDV